MYHPCFHTSFKRHTLDWLAMLVSLTLASCSLTFPELLHASLLFFKCAFFTGENPPNTKNRKSTNPTESSSASTRGNAELAPTLNAMKVFPRQAQHASLETFKEESGHVKLPSKHPLAMLLYCHRSKLRRCFQSSPRGRGICESEKKTTVSVCNRLA
jgi:hypothetical protein